MSRPEPRNGQRQGGRGKGLDILSSLGRSQYPSQPKPVMSQFYSGRGIATEIVTDRVWPIRPQVIQLFNGGCTIGTALTGVDDYFQSVLFATAIIDTNVNAVVGGVIKNAFSMLARALQSQRKLMIRDTLLDNINATNPDSFAYYLTHYINAFLGTRGLVGILNTGNFNATTAEMSNAVNNSLMRLTAAVNRLNLISMSPTLMRTLDRLCGPKALDKDGVVLIQQYGAGGAVLDLTQNSSITTVLSAIEGELNLILGTGAPANMIADMNRITNILAMCYGETTPTSPKELSFNPIEWAMIANQAITFHGTTSLKLFTQPSDNTAYPNIPILLPKGSDHKSEEAEQMFSLWRPSVYSKDPAGNSAVTVGLFSGSNGNGTLYSVYSQSGVTLAGSIEFSGIDAVTYANVAGGQLSPMIDTFLFANQALGEFGNNINLEGRSMRDWDIYYTPEQWLIEETAYSLEKWILGDIVQKPVR